MTQNHYDIVTVGGGIAASTFAITMAREGVRVLVLERENEFKDRVRGEALVPVGEAQKLGIYDLLKQSCGHEQPWFDVFLGPHQLMHRDLLATTPQRAPVCSFHHPRMQEVLITVSAEAGRISGVPPWLQASIPGSQPVVQYQFDGRQREVRSRLIAVADGRVSVARKWAGFRMEHDAPTLLLAGILFDNVSIPDDLNYIMTNPMSYQGAYMFPQGKGRVRTSCAYPVNSPHRLQCEANIPHFIEACVKAGAPAEYFRGVKTAGPLASFETADTWVAHPYKNGIALLGDAAASTDPSWGNGLALSLRSASILHDCLVANPDWGAASNAYAREFARVYDVIHNVTTWARQIFMESGPAADARREKAMPLIAQDPTRVPDHGISGPDLPFDKSSTRAHFFGEV